MKRETVVWTTGLILGALGLLLNGVIRGAGSAYIEATPLAFVRVAR